MNGVLKFLFLNNTGRAIVAGVIFLGAMAAARYYYVDRPRELAADAQGAGQAMLESMAEKLEDARSEAADPEAFAETLPDRSEWYPAQIPCGAVIPFPPEREPIWDVLAVPKEGKTGFQYRFERRGDLFVLRARRDSDCDNFYAVYTLTGRTDWTTVLSNTEILAENVEE